MIPPSRSLALQFRRKPKPHEVSGAAEVVKEATRESYEFLEAVALEVPYSLYVGKLKIQEFESLRMLALSDEFEAVTDEARTKALQGQDLESLREQPEYLDIRRRLKEKSEELSKDEDNDSWQRRQRKHVRRAAVRAARSPDPNSAARAAMELLDREIPKASRTLDEPRPVEISEESAARLQKALEARAQARKAPEVPS